MDESFIKKKGDGRATLLLAKVVYNFLLMEILMPLMNF